MAGRIIRTARSTILKLAFDYPYKEDKRLHYVLPADIEIVNGLLTAEIEVCRGLICCEVRAIVSVYKNQNNLNIA